jgi:hypothetical protein
MGIIRTRKNNMKKYMALCWGGGGAVLVQDVFKNAVSTLLARSIFMSL